MLDFSKESRTWETFFHQGVALLHQGNHAEAAKRLRGAVTLGGGAEVLDYLGIALRRMGRFEAAQARFERSLALDARRPSTWINFAELSLARGHAEAAQEQARHALDLAPENADAWLNLGVALKQLKDSAGAEACYRRILARNPDHALAWNNLGALCMDQDRGPEAEKCFGEACRVAPAYLLAHRNLATARLRNLDAAGAEAGLDSAIRLAPGYPGFKHLLGSARLALGNLDGALEAFREALRYGREIAQLDLAAPPIRTQDPQRGCQALLAAKARLDGAGIPFCLLAGTLLGVIRDGHLLPHDKDLDLGLPWEVDREKAVACLTADGAFHIQGEPPGVEAQWARSVFHSETDCGLDLFFLRKEGDRLLCGFDHLPVPVLSGLRPFTFRDHSWLGERWGVPDPPESYLEDVYGPTWREPDVYYNTVLSNPCRLPESLPVVICIGHSHLYEALRAGRWAKASALIAQLRARGEDPFLEALASQLVLPKSKQGRA